MNGLTTGLLAAACPVPGTLTALVSPSSSDGDDALRAARGDAAAFERLYRQHHARVYRLAFRMVGSDDADDAVQDIFFRAWVKLPSYRADAAFATWLHRLALNVLMRRATRSRKATDRTISINDQKVVATVVSPDATLDIEAALGSLSPELRAAVVLHDIEGFSHEEIGQLLDISLTAARMRLYRARLELRAFAGHRADD